MLHIQTVIAGPAESFEALQLKLFDIQALLTFSEVRHVIEISVKDINLGMPTLYQGDQQPIRVALLNKTAQTQGLVSGSPEAISGQESG